MKKTILALVSLAFVVASCNCQKGECEKKENSVSLIGKKAKLTYPNMVAEVNYLNDSTIYWKTTAANDSVSEEKDLLKIEKIDDDKFFVNWIENDGTTVSQIIDLEEKTVKAFLTFEDGSGKRISQMLEGKYELE